MATHFSILAQRIPWTEEPGGPQSMGSQSRKQLKRFSIQLKQFCTQSPLQAGLEKTCLLIISSNLL